MTFVVTTSDEKDAFTTLQEKAIRQAGIETLQHWEMEDVLECYKKSRLSRMPPDDDTPEYWKAKKQ